MSELEDLEKRLKELKREQAEKLRAKENAWKQLRATCTYVYVADPDYKSLDPSGFKDSVRLKRVMHPRDVAAFVKEWGKVDALDIAPQSRVYYRTDEKILFSNAGGHSILKDVPVLCSDEQWAGILRGEIPPEWENKW